MSSRTQTPSSPSEPDWGDVELPGRIVGPNEWAIDVGDGYTVRVVVGDVEGMLAPTAITLSSDTKAITSTAWHDVAAHQLGRYAVRAVSRSNYATGVSAGFNFGHVSTDVDRDQQGAPVLGADGRPRVSSHYSTDAPPTEWWEARDRYWSKVREILDAEATVPKGSRPGAGRPPRSDEFYRQVALAYLEAAGKYTVHTYVAKRLSPDRKVSKATAERWAAEAEGRGFLAEAQPGKLRTRGPRL